jgi:hypothetical protein
MCLDSLAGEGIDCILDRAWTTSHNNDGSSSHAQGGGHRPSDARAASSNDSDTTAETKEGLKICRAGLDAVRHCFVYITINMLRRSVSFLSFFNNMRMSHMICFPYWLEYFVCTFTQNLSI